MKTLYFSLAISALISTQITAMESDPRKLLTQSAETRVLTSQLVERSETPLPLTVTRICNALFDDARIKISGQSNQSTEILIKAGEKTDLEQAKFNGPVTISVMCQLSNTEQQTKRDQVELSSTRKLIVTLINKHPALVTPDEWNQYLASRKATGSK